jgi:dihydroorotase
VKVFAGSSTGDLLVEDDESLERVMRSGRRRVCYHSEDEYRCRRASPPTAPACRTGMHAEWRDVECAFLGTRRLMALARKTGRPAHILHVSTAEELELPQGPTATSRRWRCC